MYMTYTSHLHHYTLEKVSRSGVIGTHPTNLYLWYFWKESRFSSCFYHVAFATNAPFLVGSIEIHHHLLCTHRNDAGDDLRVCATLPRIIVNLQTLSSEDAMGGRSMGGRRTGGGKLHNLTPHPESGFGSPRWVRFHHPCSAAALFPLWKDWPESPGPNLFQEDSERGRSLACKFCSPLDHAPRSEASSSVSRPTSIVHLNWFESILVYLLLP